MVRLTALSKIVGAGLAGLFLAVLLDKAGIPYQIYERATTVKPLGIKLTTSLPPSHVAEMTFGLYV